MVAIRQRRGWMGSVAIGVFILWLSYVQGYAAPPHQGGDYAVPGGRFFPQTTQGEGGFSVLDDSQARFWAEYQRLGGSQTVGFPISRRFVYDGFVTQAFQKLVLQWRPDMGIAYPINVFDELSEAGHDDLLNETRQTPYPLVAFDQPHWTWAQIIANRQALLNANPAIRARYFSVSDPLNVFGVPTSAVEDMGNHYAIRTQRAVFQQWKENVPWASAGQVTIANGGSIAQELDWLPAEALIPENTPNSPATTPTPATSPVAEWQPETLLVAANSGKTLWLLQSRPDLSDVERRLLVSGDSGATWTEFTAGLPPTRCMNSITLDYNTPNHIYVSACDGLYQWDGGVWVQRSEAAFFELVIQYGDDETWWAIQPKENGGSQLTRSDDAGETWQRLAAFALGADSLIVDSSTNAILYARRVEYGSVGGPKVLRMDATVPNSAALLNVGYEPNVYNRRPTALTIDGATGDLYAATEWNSNLPTRIWRSTNADDPAVNHVFWEEQGEWEGQPTVTYMAGGRDENDRFVLYAITTSYRSATAHYTLYQSVDEGRVWQEVVIPR
jgi:hypothetical protein